MFVITLAYHFWQALAQAKVLTLDEFTLDSEEEIARKLLKVTRYTNLKNLATSFEYFLKYIAERGAGNGFQSIAGLGGKTLDPLIKQTMDRETWIQEYRANKSLTYGDNSASFENNLQSAFTINDIQARNFIITSLVRNMVVHYYIEEDWFFGNLFGEMSTSIYFCIFYSWHVAKKNNWL